jgi:hypothetical protein
MTPVRLSEVRHVGRVVEVRFLTSVSNGVWVEMSATEAREMAASLIATAAKAE